jgi:hypothetical protein
MEQRPTTTILAIYGNHQNGEFMVFEITGTVEGTYPIDSLAEAGL